MGGEASMNGQFDVRMVHTREMVGQRMSYIRKVEREVIDRRDPNMPFRDEDMSSKRTMRLRG